MSNNNNSGPRFMFNPMWFHNYTKPPVQVLVPRPAPMEPAVVPQENEPLVPREEQQQSPVEPQTQEKDEQIPAEITPQQRHQNVIPVITLSDSDDDNDDTLSISTFHFPKFSFHQFNCCFFHI